MGVIAKLDTLSKPKNLPRTTVGGLIVILTYCFVLIMFLIYVVTVSEAEYPREVSVKAFPGRDDAEKIYMPTTYCLADGGCYIRPAAATLEQCMFVPQGEAVPKSHLRLHYNSDAFEYFSVLSTTSVQNFALSYEFEKVTRYSEPLKTETIPAATSLNTAGASAYKFFRGVSIMNLIRTKGISETVDSWGAVTTSSVPIQSTVNNINCANQTIIRTDGTQLYDRATNPITNRCYTGGNWNENCWTTSVQAGTTYTEITVLNPLEASTILGLIGGWIGLMGTVGMVLFAGYKQIFGDPRDENGENGENGSSNATGNGEKSTEMSSAAPNKI